MAMDWFLPPRQDESDESLASFVERRLGREALERMAQPMIAGIYGADPRALSLGATMPRFVEMERTHGSVIRAMVARRRVAGAQHEVAKTRRPAAGDSYSQKKSVQSGSAAQESGVSGARYSLFMSFRHGMQTLVDALASRLAGGIVRTEARVSRLARA